jgi:hypothetical protein
MDTNTINTSNISAFTAPTHMESKVNNQPTFELHHVQSSGQPVIVSTDQLYSIDPKAIKLQASVLIKSTTASCWLEAKMKFGYPLTDFQAYLLAKSFPRAA